MPKRIFTFGCQIPGTYGEFVEFDSRASLLDADIVLFYPTFRPYLHAWNPTKVYRGRPRLSAKASMHVEESIGHWKRELTGVLDAGKTVFVMLSDPETIYLDNYISTVYVEPPSSARNYDILPLPMSVIESIGNSMALDPGESLLRDYWRQFGDDSQYRVYIEGTSSLRPLVTTHQGGRVVGAISRFEGGGALVALPWMDFRREGFLTESDNQLSWTSSAAQWGSRFSEILISMDSTIRSKNQVTLAPQWALDDDYTTKKEAELSQSLLGVQGQISVLEKRREDIETQMTDARWLKALLFEQGQPLENAVLKAMRLMGFEASSYRDSTSEFDVVLECPEGRCIGEVEGRDNKPIDINKMRQLIVNIQEDFSREEVSQLAKGILFGNAHRLTIPADRPAEHFTDKCTTSAKGNGIALIRTCDLFEVARVLIDNPDEDFAALCRQAILQTSGQEVQFPVLPETEAGVRGKRTKSMKTVAKGSPAVSK